MFHFKPLNSIQLTHLPEAQQQVAETLNNEFANILDSVQTAPSPNTEASRSSAADRYVSRQHSLTELKHAAITELPEARMAIHSRYQDAMQEAGSAYLQERAALAEEQLQATGGLNSVQLSQLISAKQRELMSDLHARSVARSQATEARIAQRPGDQLYAIQQRALRDQQDIQDKLGVEQSLKQYRQGLFELM
jgi:hypothetical protein